LRYGYLDFAFEVSFEAAVHDFSLTWFEAIDYRWDGSDVICHTVQDKLFVDKVGNGDFVDGMIEVKTRLLLNRLRIESYTVRPEPFLSVVGLLF